MTQFAKEEIRQKILEAAREEFLKCGFEKASIRAIAAAAKTAKSNLYNYYADKDALFSAVLGPTVSSIRAGLELASSENAGTGVESYTSASQGDYMRIVTEFVGAHPMDIMLLLFQSGGSSLAGFKVEVIENFTDVLVRWFAGAMQGRAPSRLFTRCVASFYITAIEQMLTASVTREQAEEYLGEFLKFVYGGWSSVIK